MKAPRLMVASPGYIRTRGAPATAAELVGHDGIFGPGASGKKGWAVIDGGKERPLPVGERFNVGSAEGLVALAKAGLGLAIASLWMCRAEVASGALVPVLPQLALAPAEVHAVFPAGRQPSRKVRVLTDYLAAALRSD